jgi:spore maturation protein CgeB
VAEIVSALDERRARQVGGAALRRVLSEHTYAHRALEVEAALGLRAGKERVA